MLAENRLEMFPKFYQTKETNRLFGLSLSLSDITRCSLFALLIFTPLARASVQGWAVSVILIITLFGLTSFLLDRSLTWEWKWIRTPLDKPILALLVLAILSTIFSSHRPTSFRALMLFVSYLVFFT